MRPSHPTLRRRIGFLPRKSAALPRDAGREFLRWSVSSRAAQGRGRPELPRVMGDVSSLTETANQVIGELSHGFRKRVGIAQAISATKPRS